MKKKNILSKVIIWIQIALFATVVILTFLIGGYFQIQTRHDKEISENIRLQDEVRKLEDRLDGDAVLVREMMYTVTDKKIYGLQTGTNSILRRTKSRKI